MSKLITSRDAESLDRYLQEVGRESLLSQEEEAVLARRIREGDRRAVDKLTRANLRYVITVAKQYQGQGLSLEDLINEGNIGLIRAAEKFDESHGGKFVSYAAWWIRQSIEEALAQNGDMVKQPAEKGKKKTITAESPIRRSHISVDAPLSESNKNTLLDFLPSEGREADSTMQIGALNEEIQNAFLALNDREKIVLGNYFGINGVELTMAEIGEKMGVTRERVRQIRKKALRHLRSNVKSESLKTYLNTIK